MPLQQIRPDFSGSEASMQAAQKGIGQVGTFANEWMDRIAKEKAVATEEQRYQTEQKRLGVLDERATQLWNEQQKEKENLLIAGQLKANPLALQEAVLAQDPRFNTAMAKATSAGLDTGTMGVKGVMDWYGSQTPTDNINISTGVPNVSGTTGSAITKTVARQIPVSSDTGTQPQGLVQQQPQTIIPAYAPTVQTPERARYEDKLIGQLVQQGKYNTGVGFGDGAHGTKDVRFNEKGSKILSDAMKAYDVRATPEGKQALVEAKAAQVLIPQTPKQQQTSKTQMKTVLEKVVTGHTSGTPPKLNQIEAATIDKLFAGIDPNAQSRESAKTSIEGLYYSLGLNPKQVKEYAEGTVESVYGDKNDPIKLAVANAKLGAYEKNVEGTNRLGMEMYKEGQANYRQAQTLAQSAKQHRDNLAATKQKDSAFLKAFDTKSGALTAEMEADPVGFADRQEAARRAKWAGRYKEKYGDEGWYDTLAHNQSDWIDTQIAAENLKIEKQRAEKKSK